MDELVRIALVGTSKHPAVDAVEASHPTDALLARVDAGEREDRFLLRAGARAVFEQCGHVARIDIDLPEACPADSRPPATQSLVPLLESVMSGGSWDLFIEFAQDLAVAGLVLPPELLPRALEVSDAAVREHVLPVLGERGQWLSRLNPDWQWVGEELGRPAPQDRERLQRRWEHGTIRERCEALRTLRAAAPGEARAWLEAALDEEKAEHRAELLQTLEVGLSREDEPLLESRLDDRSEQVRRAASGLLMRLPESAVAARMRDRADSLLTANSAGKVRKRLKLTCDPPGDLDQAWYRDGVPRKAAGRGTRAVWTEAVLAAVPPAHWCRRLEAEPERLLEAIADDDFAESVVAGWTAAAVTFAAADPESAAWLKPLWDYWSSIGKRAKDHAQQREVLERLQGVLTAMPPQEAEAALQPLLKEAASGRRLEVLSLLSQLPQPWSESFALHYLTTVRGVLRRRLDDRGYPWANTLPIAGRAVPRATFDAALAPWNLADVATNDWYAAAIVRDVENFLDTIRTRRTFFHEIQHPRRSTRGEKE